ncbi:MAG: anti-sigma factor, partial [Gammaproteobacteria bacterium]|nr:anti-sigma factor [Gammaproteobacteria bacterium]
LMPLAESVEPKSPPADTWPNIANALRLERPGRLRSAALWQGLAAVLAVAALALGTLLITQTAPPGPSHVAVVTDADIGPIWLLQAYIDRSELIASTINERPTPPDSDYELWMLPDDGSAPVSLGLMPEQGDAVLALVSAQIDVLIATSTLAVSVEPTGGSPTGAPTGPVIYTAPLLAT